MLKIGDRFKDKTTGKIYIIRMEIGNDTLCLEGQNGLGRRLTGKKSLPPGRYEYRFWVDGVWHDNPNVYERVENPFGSQNCVVIVS